MNIVSSAWNYLADYREIFRDVVTSPQPNFTEKDYPDLAGRVYIVTGGTSGIGFEAARLLLSRGAKVYITGRTPSKIEHALSALGEVGPVKSLPIHHEDSSTIAPAVKDFLKEEHKLNGIIHNAGINYRGQNVVEPIGLLDIIVINVLAAQSLQMLSIPLLESTPGSRTVWVTSAIHYYSPPDGIVYDKADGGFSAKMNEYDCGAYLGKGNGMYGQTKAMNIYQAIQWGKRYPNVISVSAHPGAIASDIRRTNRWRGFVMGVIMRPTIMGAYQVVQPLLDPAVTTKNNGTYYVPFGVEGRVRPDVREAAEGERGDEFWEWISRKVSEFK